MYDPNDGADDDSVPPFMRRPYPLASAAPSASSTPSGSDNSAAFPPSVSHQARRPIYSPPPVSSDWRSTIGRGWSADVLRDEDAAAPAAGANNPLPLHEAGQFVDVSAAMDAYHRAGQHVRLASDSAHHLQHLQSTVLGSAGTPIDVPQLHDVASGLPAIIVVGDQSSGKSSLLEALSGVKLIARAGIGTRVAVKLLLRKQAQDWGQRWEATVAVERNTSRSLVTEFTQLTYSAENRSQVSEGINRAQAHIIRCENNPLIAETAFVIVTVKSAEVADLNLTDLPGLVAQRQNANSKERIENMIETCPESSIVLHVRECDVAEENCNDQDIVAFLRPSLRPSAP